MDYVLEIHYDDDVLLQASLRREEFEREAPLLLAAKLYELGRLSSGRAAKLCGMARVDFLMTLRRVGVAIASVPAAELEDDIRFALRG